MIVILAAIYVATFVLSFLYWTFDDMKNGRGMFCSRRRSSRPANSSLDQAKYGGKYGAGIYIILSYYHIIIIIIINIIISQN